MALINKINVGGTHYDLGGSMLYGVCSTAAATAAKEVTVNGNFTLEEGAMVVIKFTEANSVDAPTLNVNNTGAKSMKRYGTQKISTSTSTSGWIAGAVTLFVYDGTNWVRDYWSNSTYSNASLGQGYATCSTAEATVAKAATLSSYTFSNGGIVSVKFSNAVPASATLNINSKGEKAIYFRGAAITANVIKAGDIATFITEDASTDKYHLISIDRWQNDIANLATVATSGSYNDLTNKPTIPTYSAAGTSLGLVKSGGDVTISDGVITVNDDSHNHTIANVDGLQTELAIIYDYWLYLTEMGYLNRYDAESTDGVTYTASTGGYTSNNLHIGNNIIIVPNKTSTSTTPTLKIGNTATTGIRIAQPEGAGVNNLPSAGYLVANTPYYLIYDGTYWVLDAKITGAASTIADTNLTASRALISNSSGKVAVSDVTSTELGYLDGVTSAIQTQLNNKAAKATSLSGYGITDAYTKTEVDNKGYLTKVGTSNIEALAITEPKIANGTIGISKLDVSIQAAITNVGTLIGSDANKSVRAIAAEVVAEQLGVIENGTY